MLSAWGLSCASSSIGISLLLSSPILSCLLISYLILCSLLYSSTYDNPMQSSAPSDKMILPHVMSWLASYLPFLYTPLSHILPRKIMLCYGVIRHHVSCHLTCIAFYHIMSCHIILYHTISHFSMRIQAGLHNNKYCTLSSLSEVSLPHPTLP